MTRPVFAAAVALVLVSTLLGACQNMGGSTSSSHPASTSTNSAKPASNGT